MTIRPIDNAVMPKRKRRARFTAEVTAVESPESDALWMRFADCMPATPVKINNTQPHTPKTNP